MFVRRRTFGLRLFGHEFLQVVGLVVFTALPPEGAVVDAADHTGEPEGDVADEQPDKDSREDGNDWGMLASLRVHDRWWFTYAW